MSTQRKILDTDSSQIKIILDLERKYMKELSLMIESQQFKIDLINIQLSIQNEYDRLTDIWFKKNKFKEASERLIRHHIYTYFKTNIKGFYPYPVTSDIGLIFDDCILNVDVKSIDPISNSADLKNIPFEHNQTSFIHDPVYKNETFQGIYPEANLECTDNETKLPVLTFLVKIYYYDNGKDEFQIMNDNKFPTITLACLPNGILSELFDHKILQGFKTYSYFSKDIDKYYRPIKICNITDFNSLADRTTKLKKIRSIVKKNAFTQINLNKCTDLHFITSKKSKEKYGLFDSTRNINWIQVNKNGILYLYPLRGGNTGRFYRKFLENRYDSNNNSWNGVIDYFKILDK